MAYLPLIISYLFYAIRGIMLGAFLSRLTQVLAVNVILLVVISLLSAQLALADSLVIPLEGYIPRLLRWPGALMFVA